MRTSDRRGTRQRLPAERSAFPRAGGLPRGAGSGAASTAQSGAKVLRIGGYGMSSGADAQDGGPGKSAAGRQADRPMDASGDSRRARGAGCRADEMPGCRVSELSSCRVFELQRS
ncbi:hypothetical protein SLNWT_5546 [Streptomyces albus]|uniref:Uncharacterized protein n=1 Tax=Streptomyces albus (strain ATCC 21838 / DSM 41398 / FERM P-419 / JCM 4703 / NBRC 107858) TaxID=1081613 RepID=A0A0B5F6G5_STRA4|nr:hypothetical protein SLNWT_5546 [Streptomyces albus]AOU80225.1 hypothetical protein SLNHY_5534 [Streptomyces albus]AYN35938.1 hypothetical protein DUI70_5445 [Streptomyces albus]